jgi:hypothetical protein
VISSHLNFISSPAVLARWSTDTIWSRREAKQISAEPAVCCLCRLGFRVCPSFWKKYGDWKDDSPQGGWMGCGGGGIVGIIADASY